jgi:hypothetical protein
MDIEKQIKRIVKRLWTELTGDLHLPQWGRVVALHQIDAPVKFTPSEPHYCVDVQVLNRQGKDDTAVPVLTKVPLPATGAGEQRGFFCYPKVGALVELSFILGQVNKPFIRSVFVEGVTLPALQENDTLLSKDATNYYRIDSTDSITERCQNIADRWAKVKQRLVVKNGGKVWVGNETDNTLTLVSELMGEVIKIADALATHKHGGVMGGSASTSTADNAGIYSSASSATGTLKGKLDAIKE